MVGENRAALIAQIGAMTRPKITEGKSLDLAGAINNYYNARDVAGEKIKKQQDLDNSKALADAIASGDETAQTAAAARLDPQGTYNYLQQIKNRRAEADLAFQRQKELANMNNKNAVALKILENDLKGQAGGNNFKDAERQAATYAARMNEAAGMLDKFEEEGGGYFGSGNNKVGGSLAAALRSIPVVGASDSIEAAAGKLEGKAKRDYDAAALNWITANLRKESGAAIGADEYKNEYKKYFALPGDSDETIKKKRLSRQLAQRGMVYQSGGAYDDFMKQNQPKVTDKKVDYVSKYGLE